METSTCAAKQVEDCRAERKMEIRVKSTPKERRIWSVSMKQRKDNSCLCFVLMSSYQ